MNVTIPFEKEILFKSKIAEICSISLEHDVSINDKELLGDFILEGEYKNLDVNVDVLPFSHVVPFQVALEDDIDINTLKYEIEDFTYDVLNDDTLKVNIKFHVEADKIAIIERENIFEEVEIDDEPEVILDEKKEEREDNLDKESINLINSNNFEEDYITYHVHEVKINETIESISTLYNINKDTLLSLNDIKSISLGDKLIIPDLNE